MIPEPQRFNILLRDKSFTNFITMNPFGQTVLKAVKLDSQLSIGAIEIQNVSTNRVLLTEFKTSEAPSAQRPPEFFFLLGLSATKLSYNVFQAHAQRMWIAEKISSPLTPSLSPFGRGEGEGSRRVEPN